jgi:glycerol uptake facilitator-like aquaporin
MTFMFLMIILVDDGRAPDSPRSPSIRLTLIHPSAFRHEHPVNPARSTGPALSWAAGPSLSSGSSGRPLIGAALAGLAYRGLSAEAALTNSRPDLRAPRRW